MGAGTGGGDQRTAYIFCTGFLTPEILGTSKYIPLIMLGGCVLLSLKSIDRVKLPLMMYFLALEYNTLLYIL